MFFLHFHLCLNASELCNTAKRRNVYPYFYLFHFLLPLSLAFLPPLPLAVSRCCYFLGFYRWKKKLCQLTFCDQFKFKGRRSKRSVVIFNGCTHTALISFPSNRIFSHDHRTTSQWLDTMTNVLYICYMFRPIRPSAGRYSTENTSGQLYHTRARIIENIDITKVKKLFKTEYIF